MDDLLAAALERLKDPNENVRARAALDIGTLEDPRAGNPLIARLRVEPDLLVREKLTWALVRTGGVVERLVALLKDANPQVRHDAAHVLSKTGDRSAVDALIDATRDDDALVLTKVAFALGRFAEARAVPALVQLLGHESRELQSTLHSVLETFGAQSRSALLTTLKSETWRAREQAAYVLGFVGTAGDVSALRPLLRDQRWEVRFAAAHALRDLGGADAQAAIDTLRDARIRECDGWRPELPEHRVRDPQRVAPLEASP